VPQKHFIIMKPNRMKDPVTLLLLVDRKNVSFTAWCKQFVWEMVDWKEETMQWIRNVWSPWENCRGLQQEKCRCGRQVLLAKGARERCWSTTLDIIYIHPSHVTCAYITRQLFSSDTLLQKYPLYQEYLNKAVDRRKEWGLCYRTDLRMRGNNTDNYTESMIFVFKCVNCSKTNESIQPYWAYFISSQRTWKCTFSESFSPWLLVNVKIYALQHVALGELQALLVEVP